VTAFALGLWAQYKLQVCLQLHTSADNVTLLAFAADRRAAVRRRLLQQSTAAPTAANPPHAAAAVDRWTGRTDCRGTGRRTDSVPLRRPCRIIARPVSIMLLLFLLLCPDRGAAYGDERVCLSACVCVCVCLSIRDHIFGTIRPIFTKFLRLLPLAVARSFASGVVIRYVLPVLWMTSYLLTSQGCSTSPPS